MNIEAICENIYEDLGGFISSIESTYMSISFLYETEHWEHSNKRVTIRVDCESVAESTLNLEVGGTFQLFTEHPVLDEYSGHSGTLFFSSPPVNTNEIIGLLYTAHQEYFKGMRDFSKYLNLQFSLNELLKSGNGSLAFGPINVLKIYHDAIQDKLKVNIVNSHKNTENYKVLFVEDTFVMAMFP